MEENGVCGGVVWIEQTGKNECGSGKASEGKSCGCKRVSVFVVGHLVDRIYLVLGNTVGRRFWGAESFGSI